MRGAKYQYDVGRCASDASDGTTLKAGAQSTLRSEPSFVQELTRRLANDWACAMPVIPETARRFRSFALNSTIHLGHVSLAITRCKFEELGIRLVFVAEALPMPADSRLRLRMIACELLTHLARYVSCGWNSCAIRVDMCCRRRLAECHVCQSRSVRPDFPPRHGLAVAHERIARLRGHVKRDFGPGGSTSTLQFPL